jgi:hypothetical protein
MAQPDDRIESSTHSTLDFSRPPPRWPPKQGGLAETMTDQIAQIPVVHRGYGCVSLYPFHREPGMMRMALQPQDRNWFRAMIMRIADGQNPTVEITTSRPSELWWNNSTTEWGIFLAGHWQSLPLQVHGHQGPTYDSNRIRIVYLAAWAQLDRPTAVRILQHHPPASLARVCISTLPTAMCRDR